MIKRRTNDKSIMLTFDYELFFKNSGTPARCLIEPVNRLLQLFEKYDIRATFFIDILYFVRLLENASTADDAKLIRSQLQRIVDKGSRIELHLHPHWLDARFKDGSWEFPSYNNYRLQSLPKERITDLFVFGTQLIESIGREVVPDYKVIAFRGGGWCIQPFDCLIDGFIKSGIKVDSTVAYGIKGESSCHFFDFTHAPNIEYYKFKNNPCEEDNSGDFFEIPITSYRRGLVEKFFKVADIAFYKEAYRICGDGKNIALNKRLIKKIFPSHEMFSLERINKYILKKRIEESDRSLINFISHTKCLSASSYAAIKMLAELNYNFVTILDVLNQISED